MNQSSCLLQVFLKAPEPGKVKTRLIPDLGEVAATEIHQKLVQHVLQVADSAGLETECWIAGDVAHPFVQSLAQRYAIHQQTGIDLGERMYNALLFGLERHERVLLVGADAYSLTPQVLADASAALAHHEVVLGPAQDGGYFLVGVNKLHPDFFADIDWGTAAVLAEQLENLQRCHLRYTLLAEGYDIDSLDDLRHFAPELLP